MSNDEERPTVPPGLDELRYDAVRLRWAEKGAYYLHLLERIRSHPEVSAAFDRWLQAHERRVQAEEQVARFEGGTR